MPHRQEVVVVDGLPETTQVLRAVFEPQGHRVSRRTSQQIPLDESVNSARVLVLHDATDSSLDGPQVMVGRVAGSSDRSDSRTLSQPFQYADLIAAIDALMDRPAA